MNRCLRPTIFGPLVLLALLGGVLAGCRREAAQQRPVNHEATESQVATGPSVTLSGHPPADDDVLLMFYVDDPDTLNLITSNDTVSREFQMFVYESLGEGSLEDPDYIGPGLAESWEFDEETLTYTIHLRRGVQWHPATLPNGGRQVPAREFTAADVKFTFDAIMNEHVEAASLRSYFVDAEAEDPAERYKIDVRVVDPYTVEIQWTKPYILSDEFTLGTPIMPRHVYGVDADGEPITLDFRGSREFAQVFNNHAANTTMVGTGPLMFESWERQQEARLARNPNYWGAPFYFSRVIYRRVVNPNTAVQQGLQGELDFVVIAEKDLYVANLNHPNVQAGRVRMDDFFYPGYRYLGFNLERPLFQDQRVRWAISHAVPVQDIIDQILHGLADRVTGPFIPGSPYNNDELPFIEHDLDRARELLDEAGWIDTTGDGVRNKTIAGRTQRAAFEVIIYAQSPQFRAIAEIVRENCRQIGIDVTITPVQWALMLQKMRQKEFDACILGWAMSWKSDPYQIWHGSQADVPDSSNSISYRNPEVDRAIDELRVTLDPDRQQELYHEIHRLIYEDQPYTFLFADRRTVGINGRLENLEFYKVRPGYDIREWYSTSPRTLGR